MKERNGFALIAPNLHMLATIARITALKHSLCPRWDVRLYKTKNSLDSFPCRNGRLPFRMWIIIPLYRWRWRSMTIRIVLRQKLLSQNLLIATRAESWRSIVFVSTLAKSITNILLIARGHVYCYRFCTSICWLWNFSDLICSAIYFYAFGLYGVRSLLPEPLWVCDRHSARLPRGTTDDESLYSTFLCLRSCRNGFVAQEYQHRGANPIGDRPEKIDSGKKPAMLEAKEARSHLSFQHVRLK